MSKVFVIMQDENGNFHQGVMDKSKEIFISKLVKVYPNNNFTKELIEIIEIIENLNNNIKKLK